MLTCLTCGTSLTARSRTAKTTSFFSAFSSNDGGRLRTLSRVVDTKKFGLRNFKFFSEAARDLRLRSFADISSHAPDPSCMWPSFAYMSTIRTVLVTPFIDSGREVKQEITYPSGSCSKAASVEMYDMSSPSTGCDCPWGFLSHPSAPPMCALPAGLEQGPLLPLDRPLARLLHCHRCGHVTKS